MRQVENIWKSGSKVMNGESRNLRKTPEVDARDLAVGLEGKAI